MHHLLELDTRLFLFLNGMHSPAWDPFWEFITLPWMWIPVAIFTLYCYWKKWGRKIALMSLVYYMVLFALTESTTTIAKNTFKRWRPCHDSRLKGKVHNPSGCGSPYGFFSAHAANSASITTTIFLDAPVPVVFKGMVALWALLHSYSRIYLGVHYPLDVLAGWAAGIFLAWIAFQFWKKFKRVSVLSQ